MWNIIVYSFILCPATVTAQEVILNIKYKCFVSFKDITVLFKEKIEWVAREEIIMKNCAQIYYGNQKKTSRSNQVKRNQNQKWRCINSKDKLKLIM
jgi:hypothetical protein